MIHWGAQQVLYALAALPPLGALAFMLLQRRERQLRRIMDETALAALLPSGRMRRHRRRLGYWLAALTLGIVALARPQWGEKWLEVRHMGLDILVVLDTSNSMRAEDIRPNRLDRAKLGLRDLTRHLRGDRVGLIPFAGTSYLYCPLTSDYAAFLMMLNDVQPGIIPRGGTASEQALRLALHTFDDSLLADRVILLITDGEDHEGNPLNLIHDLRRRNIRVFAVGVGTPEGDLIPMTDERGGQMFLRDRVGNIVRTRLQEDMLERLAARTGGMYVRATPGDFGLDLIYEQGIAPLQRELMESEMLLVHEERFAWFLTAALLLLCIECLTSRTLQPTRKKSAVVTVGLCILIMPGVTMAGTARQSMELGLRLLEDGKFEAAAEAFQEAAQRAPDQRLDASRAWFNRGNALFAKGDFEGAAHAYREALLSSDLTIQQHAHFNRGNALFAKALHAAEQQQLEVARERIGQALENYQNALLLDPGDAAAKLNHELADLVRKQIEELIEQQPPPPPQPEAGDPEEPEDPGTEESPAPEPEPGEDEVPPDTEPSPGEPSLDESEPVPQPASMDEMTQEEAMLLLDALRDEEQQTRDQIQLPIGPPEEVEKDW